MRRLYAELEGVLDHYAREETRRLSGMSALRFHHGFDEGAELYVVYAACKPPQTKRDGCARTPWESSRTWWWWRDRAVPPTALRIVGAGTCRRWVSC